MNYNIEKLGKLQTPFYYYDMELLQRTLDTITKEATQHEGYCIHYAVKANANPRILKEIAKAGLGADCVSGWEVQRALECGFPASKIVFAGVAKMDSEILLSLENDIFCFNVESREELEVIQNLAQQTGKTARVELRINPNVGAHTHAKITTGVAENKFGIPMEEMEQTIALAEQMSNIEFVGLHFHIGSQLLVMDDFVALSHRVNELQDRLEAQGITLKNINVGGGLGIDYQNPDANPVPDFKALFDTYATHLKLRPGQQLHFEPGRSIVGQCGMLVASTIYVKQAPGKQFCILNAGMTDLIRPALYDAYHQVDNLSNPEGEKEQYDVVGPICESSDVFVKDYMMPKAKRGDLIGLRSAGAYGEIMASQYNCRPLAPAYFSDQI